MSFHVGSSLSQNHLNLSSSNSGGFNEMFGSTGKDGGVVDINGTASSASPNTGIGGVRRDQNHIGQGHGPIQANFKQTTPQHHNYRHMQTPASNQQQQHQRQQHPFNRGSNQDHNNNGEQNFRSYNTYTQDNRSDPRFHSPTNPQNRYNTEPPPPEDVFYGQDGTVHYRAQGHNDPNFSRVLDPELDTQYRMDSSPITSVLKGKRRNLVATTKRKSSNVKTNNKRVRLEQSRALTHANTREGSYQNIDSDDEEFEEKEPTTSDEEDESDDPDPKVRKVLTLVVGDKNYVKMNALTRHHWMRYWCVESLEDGTGDEELDVVLDIVRKTYGDNIDLKRNASFRASAIERVQKWSRDWQRAVIKEMKAHIVDKLATHKAVLEDLVRDREDFITALIGFCNVGDFRAVFKPIQSYIDWAKVYQREDLKSFFESMYGILGWEILNEYRLHPDVLQSEEGSPSNARQICDTPSTTDRNATGLPPKSSEGTPRLTVFDKIRLIARAKVFDHVDMMTFPLVVKKPTRKTKKVKDRKKEQAESYLESITVYNARLGGKGGVKGLLEDVGSRGAGRSERDGTRDAEDFVDRHDLSTNVNHDTFSDENDEAITNHNNPIAGDRPALNSTDKEAVLPHVEPEVESDEGDARIE